MSEYIGLIIGLTFFLILMFGGSVLEFLDSRRQQKFKHELEMTKVAARKRNTDDDSTTPTR